MSRDHANGPDGIDPPCALPDYSGMLERGAYLTALQEAAEMCLNRSESIRASLRRLEAESCAIAIFRKARELAKEHRAEIMWNRKLVLLVETGDASEPDELNAVGLPALDGIGDYPETEQD